MAKKSNWVTIVDGGEVDYGCMDCHYRMFVQPNLMPKTCPGCGAEMENKIGLVTIVKRHKDDPWKVIEEKETEY